jgi:hypothetical protein
VPGRSLRKLLPLLRHHVEAPHGRAAAKDQISILEAFDFVKWLSILLPDDDALTTSWTPRAHRSIKPAG